MLTLSERFLFIPSIRPEIFLEKCSWCHEIGLFQNHVPYKFNHFAYSAIENIYGLRQYHLIFAERHCCE